MIFVAGSLHWDVVVDAPRLPALDETLMGQGVDYRFGGKGGNQAVAAARMGARVAMAGQVGQDEAGIHLRSTLDAAGVDHTQVRACEKPSGMSVAIVDAQGEYGAVVVSGANMALRADRIAIPDDTEVLLLQNEVPEIVNLTLAQRVGDHVRVVLNAAPARAVPQALMSRIDVLVVNKGEAAAMVGADAAALDPESAAQRLCDLGPANVVVTLGAAGLVLAEQGETRRLAAFKVETVSAHGAGDMFCGALAARLAGGSSLREACMWASAAAAHAVSLPAEARAGITEDAVRRVFG